MMLLEEGWRAFCCIAIGMYAFMYEDMSTIIESVDLSTPTPSRIHSSKMTRPAETLTPKCALVAVSHLWKSSANSSPPDVNLAKRAAHLAPSSPSPT